MVRQWKKQRPRKGFWDREYRQGDHFALSDTPSEDMIKFLRWLERRAGKAFLNSRSSVLDLGCGNGRNLVYLAKTWGVRGIGYDSSQVAIGHAKKAGENLSIEWQQRSVADPLPLADASQTLVLDMMTSHTLNQTERANLRAEISRVLAPGGWLFYKTFLRDEDRHAERLLRENPAAEAGSYIHPTLGVTEYVYTEEELLHQLADQFSVERVVRSHRHLIGGRAAKRRSISIYAERKF